MELSVSQLWRSGPEWLHLDVPIHLNDSPPMPESCSYELKSKAKPSHNLLAAEELASKSPQHTESSRNLCFWVTHVQRKLVQHIIH